MTFNLNYFKIEFVNMKNNINFITQSFMNFDL